MNTTPTRGAGKAAHTETPWRVDGETGEIVRDAAPSSDPDLLTAGFELVIADVIGPDREANAAFIVKACNAHEQLVAALDKAETLLERIWQCELSPEQAMAAITAWRDERALLSARGGEV
jgi:hypothetical protein